MELFQDLTYYSYMHFENALNIGWVQFNIKNRDNYECSEMAEKDKAILNAVTSSGSVLNFAIKLRNEKLALRLLEFGFAIQNYDGIELNSAIKNKLDNVAAELINHNIPMSAETLKRNPLFIAIAYKSNDVAIRLFLEKPELRKEYSNEFVKECDLLKWAIYCGNIEIFYFISNNL